MSKLSSIVCTLHRGVLQNPVSLPCGHSFCRSCVQTLLLRSSQCPTCNSAAKRNELYPNIVLQQLIDELDTPNIIEPNELLNLVEIRRHPNCDLFKASYQDNDVVWKQPRATCESSTIAKSLKSQYSLLQQLEFPENIVRVFGVTLSPPGLVMEEMTCSVQDKFDTADMFNQNEIKRIVKSVLNGLYALHSEGIVHRDISSGNVLLLEDESHILCAKLADLELHLPSQTTLTATIKARGIGTETYLPPELIRNSNVKASLASDIYSIGVLITGLILNCDPQRVIPNFRTRTISSLRDAGLHGKILSLIAGMLDPHAQRRPSIGDVKSQIFEAIDEFCTANGGLMPSAPLVDSGDLYLDLSLPPLFPNFDIALEDHKVVPTLRPEPPAVVKPIPYKLIFYCLSALLLVIVGLIIADHIGSKAVGDQLSSGHYSNIPVFDPKDSELTLSALRHVIEDILLEFRGFRIDLLQYSSTRQMYVLQVVNRPWTRQSLMINATFTTNDEGKLASLIMSLGQQSFVGIESHDLDDENFLLAALTLYLTNFLDSFDFFDGVSLTVTTSGNGFEVSLNLRGVTESLLVDPQFVLSDIGQQMSLAVTVLEEESFENVPVHVLNSQEEQMLGVERLIQSLISVDFQLIRIATGFNVVLSLPPLTRELVILPTYVLSHQAQAIEEGLVVIKVTEMTDLPVHIIDSITQQQSAVKKHVEEAVSSFPGSIQVLYLDEDTFRIRLTYAEATDFTDVSPTFVLSQEAKDVRDAITAIDNHGFSNIVVSNVDDSSIRQAAVLNIVQDVTQQYGTSSKVVSEDIWFRMEIEISKAGAIQVVLVTTSFVLSADDQAVQDAYEVVADGMPSSLEVDDLSDQDEHEEVLKNSIASILSGYEVDFEVSFNQIHSAFQCVITKANAERVLVFSALQFVLSSTGRVAKAVLLLEAHKFENLPSANTTSDKITAIRNRALEVTADADVSIEVVATHQDTVYDVHVSHGDVSDQLQVVVLLPLIGWKKYRLDIIQHEFLCLEVTNPESSTQRREALRAAVIEFIDDETVSVGVESLSEFNLYDITLAKEDSVVALSQAGSTYVASDVKYADFYALGRYRHGMVVRNGRLWSWGAGTYGELAGGRGRCSLSISTCSYAPFLFPQSPLSFTAVKEVALGDYASLILMNDGSVHVAGRGDRRIGATSTSNAFDTPEPISAISNVQHVYSGNNHYAALSSASVWIWGMNPHGELGQGHTDNRNSPWPYACPTTFQFKKLLLEPVIHYFGRNNQGQLGDETTSNRHSAIHVLGLTNVIDIAAGEESSYALTASGLLYSWGRNAEGQLGIGSTVSQTRPYLVATKGFVVKSLHTRTTFILLISVDARLYGMGQNSNRLLRSDSTNNVHSPIRVRDLSNVKTVTVGHSHVIATFENGSSVG
ncbi:hypothetical protein GEMRC1_001665 [Eukaryota sp. GEM-RC1]